MSDKPDLRERIQYWKQRSHHELCDVYDRQPEFGGPSTGTKPCNCSQAVLSGCEAEIGRLKTIAVSLSEKEIQARRRIEELERQLEENQHGHNSTLDRMIQSLQERDARTEGQFKDYDSLAAKLDAAEREIDGLDKRLQQSEARNDRLTESLKERQYQLERVMVAVDQQQVRIESLAESLKSAEELIRTLGEVSGDLRAERWLAARKELVNGL